jgi:hypothetical protein
VVLLRPHLIGRRGAGRRQVEGQLAARSVYGAIVVLALLLAMQDHPPGPLAAAALVAGTVTAILAAEAYAEILGEEIDRHERLTRQQRLHKLRELASMSVAAEWPIAFLVLGGAGVLEDETAFRLARWVALALLFIYGFVAARMTGRSVSAALRSAVALGSIGVLLALLKSLVHL